MTLSDLERSEEQSRGHAVVLNRPTTTARSMLSQQMGNCAGPMEVVPAGCPFSGAQERADTVEAERKPGPTGLRYAEYLHLSELLGAVQPLFGDGDRPCFADERYFLIIHQVAELWVSQILIDLELALEFARLTDFDEAVDRMMRANAVLDLTITTTTALQHLTVDGFHKFRPGFQGMTAGQSAQFATLLTGVRHDPVAALLEIVAERNGDSGNARQRLQLGALLDVFIAGLTRWRLAHISAVGRFIGDSRGTGGTAGIGYLIDRLNKASCPS